MPPLAHDDNPDMHPAPETSDTGDLVAETGRLRRNISELTKEVREESEHCVTDAVATAEKEEADHESRILEVNQALEDGLKSARDQHDSTVARARQVQKASLEKIESDAKSMRDRIRSKAVSNERTARAAMAEAVWVADTVYEANEDRPKEQFEELREQVETVNQDLEELDAKVSRELRRYSQRRPRPAILTEDMKNSVGSKPETKMLMEAAKAQKSFERFRRLSIARLFRGPIMVLPAAAFIGMGIAANHVLTNDTSQPSIIRAAVIGLAIFLPVAVFLYVLARREVTRAYLPISRAILTSNHCAELALKAADEVRSNRKTKLEDDRERDIKRSHEKFEPLIEESQNKARARLDEIKSRLPGLQAAANDQCTKAVGTASDLLKQTEESIRLEHESQLASEHERHEQAVTDNRRIAIERWESLEDRWKTTLGSDSKRLMDIRDDIAGRFPGWETPAWKEWTPNDAPPPAIPLGELKFDRTDVEGGAPTDERLAVDVPVNLDIPGMIGLPSRASLEIDVDADHRDLGLEVLRAVMLRILASVPPGKARFTVLDPVGLGQNFAGFMHLEDEFPGMIGERIWTESRHIEQKLIDITEHMETVIQKYLRNEFQSIDDYNKEAGEIAEPYRFLVIADFPANFNEQSAQRLTSILSSGPRCGVFTLLLRDRRLPIPERFDMDDISRHAITVRGEGDRMIYDCEGLEHLPFDPAGGPPDDLLIEISRKVGRAAVDAGKVEVPFEMIAPDDDQFWTATSEEKMKVALGRAGATKLQYLTMGVGTSQHALIAGKTGSGKSTLLHAMITNLACWYSPEEIEFYLVDFKKGVEFKTYATHGLPHARAVAVESDREFGLSVLHGLDEELKRRGELFRSAGTQDLAAWRRKSGESMPRTLLVIDEFQELFIDDDKVSQDAGLLLDRLVRQGRAFGMHVLLGSQTLGGAYSLHRTTMGQMGIRVALQCNEQDSMLILSDDNVAARLLNRPGEAIYNDQGGLMEGNSPFQVCWLPDEVRERYLARAAELAAERYPDRDNKCIIFEGNAPANLSTNVPLRTAIESEAQNRPVSIPAWIGDAVAIKDPTSALLRRQAGGNLVIVGQQDEPALATTTACLIATAAAHPVSEVKFVVLDGTTADDPNSGYLERAAAALPHDISTPGFRDAPDAVLEVGTELARRMEGEETDASTIVLFVHGLQRFRALRRAEDDFSFSMDDEDAPMTADKAFGQIIKEGPEFGVFTVVWCDTVPSLERAVDRHGMRGFDARALFQLSSTDSSTIIDSPAASNLGPHRGLLYNEERGTIEKFRPWQLPSESLLASIGAALAKRG